MCIVQYAKFYGFRCAHKSLYICYFAKVLAVMLYDANNIVKKFKMLNI